MKNIYTKVRSIVCTRLFGVGLLIVIVLVAIFWWYSNYSNGQFIDAYNSYEVVASVQQNAAFVPGASANPVRDQLNSALAQVLSKESTAKSRLELSTSGLELVKELNKQVDAINDAATPVQAAIAGLDSSAKSPGNIVHRSKMTGLVSKANEQMATIQTIRGLSYRANFEMIQIFNRIIAEKGVLTDAYATELNNQIPAVEEEFNNRQNAYADLQRNMYDMSEAFAALGGTAPEVGY